MTKSSFFIAVVCALIWVYPAGAADNHFNTYQETSKNIIDLVTGTNIDSALILQKADELVVLGVDIAKDTSAHEIECKDFLDVFIQGAQEMKLLTMEEMELLYHEGGIFEKNGMDLDPDDDKYEECLETSHFIVHPATVPILMKEYLKDQDKMHLNEIKEELVTLYNHIKEHEGH